MSQAKTLRYCKMCQANRIFKLNRTIGHSECEECGSRFASAYRDDAIDKIENKIMDRIKELRADKSGIENKQMIINELYAILRFVQKRKKGKKK